MTPNGNFTCLHAELWPRLDTNSGQDEIILRILETKLLNLLTLQFKGSADEPRPILGVRRMKFLVCYWADPVTTSTLGGEVQDESPSDLYDFPILEGGR